jgi:hypothetical protein
MLDADVADEFLVNRTGAADSSAARDLARELGGLPLALEQAAAYMEVTGLSLAEYLGRIGQQWAVLLARGEPLGYDKRVATTWSLVHGPGRGSGLRRGRLRAGVVEEAARRRFSR